MRKTSTVQAGTKPKTLSNVVRWFLENEAPKGVGKESDGSISIWFHGERKLMIIANTTATYINVMWCNNREAVKRCLSEAAGFQA